MLTNLLARQFKVIDHLEILLPAVPMHPGVALFGHATDLSQSMAATATLIAGTDMEVSVSTDASVFKVATMEVCVGTFQNRRSRAQYSVSVLGDGWRVMAGETIARLVRTEPDNPSPFGPYFAACVGAGEVFKRLHGMMPTKGHFVDNWDMSLWDWDARDRALTMQEPRPDGLILPSAYLVGAGAVGQALVATLVAAQTRGHLTVIDDDTIDDTNANRYPLVTVHDVGKVKSKFATDFLCTSRMTAYDSPTPWPHYAYELPHSGQRADLQALEAGYKYQLVLSCVDRNRHRHAIQKFWPHYIVGSSTDDFSIQVSAYDMNTDNECLICGNPLDGSEATIESTAEVLRRLPAADRRKLLEVQDVDVGAVEEYLADPKCGEAGERELAKFLLGHQLHDWSVGFVSVAAGVLLATQLVKLAVGGAQLAFPRDIGATLRYNFLNPGPRRSTHGRRAACVCGAEGAHMFRELWS
jgi:molybdopterin/thiamine biosynthesis adenylyltransferase